MITGINHITFAVTDLDASLDFYSNFLGFRVVHTWERGVYLEAGGAWLCLALGDRVEAANDYTHVAFSTDEPGFHKLLAVVKEHEIMMWQQNRSEGDSVYILDPDGHKLEVHVGDLSSRMKHVHHTNLT